MAARKSFYYVLVMTTDGPKFVTEVNNADKTARWTGDAKPLAMSRERAEDLQVGLLWNFHAAYLVKMPFELEEQPYNYKDGAFEWRKSEED